MRAAYGRLRALSEQASQGEWFIDSVEVDGAYGRYYSCQIMAGDKGPILDAVNSAVADMAEETDEDGGSQWDRQGEADARFVAECVNYVRGRVLIDRPIFVDQTTFYDPKRPGNGNCTEAAVASILGLPLGEVPNFRSDGTEAHKFWSSFRRFIRSRGFEPIMLPGNHMHDALYLASGPSPRGVNHMVVMRAGEMVHDPHPSRAGIGAVDHVWLLVPHDPAS